MPAAAPPPAAAPAAAPKPAAAKPAPAAPPAPAKAPPAAPSREDNEPSFMGEYAAELDKLSGEDLQPPQVRKPKGKPSEKAPVKAPEKPDAGEVTPPAGDEPEPGAAAPGEPGAAAAPAAQPTTIPEIRKAFSALKKKEDEEYRPKIQKLEARVKELESTNPGEVTALQTRLKEAEQRRDELENEIRFVDFSKSKDYQENYEKPYAQAWSKALHEITQLSRFQSDGSTRKATQDDIIALANAPLDQLDKMAEEWFPNSAARVIRHVEKIKDLAEAQHEALEKARTEGAERAKTSQSTQKAATERTVKLLEDAHTAIATKWPQMFGKIEDDPDGNALLEKGERLYQRAFRPGEQEQPPTPEEAVQLHALVRAKVRNHDRLALWWKKAKAEIKELKAALEQYENSDPNGGLRTGGTATGGGVSDMLNDGLKELDAMDKKR